jgi:hypothetical protein
VKLASLLRCAAVLIATLSSTTALAQDIPEEGPEKHTGFFLQGSTGIGYLSSRYDRGVPLRLHGLTALFDVGVGYSVAPGLSLHGNLYGAIVMSPSLEIDGDDYETEGDVSLNLAGFGAGITYYTPFNLYISGAAGIGLVSLDDGDDSASLEPGFSLRAKIGYEWMLGRQLGLGLAGQLVYFRNAEKEVNGSWTSIGAGPMASLTFN